MTIQALRLNHAVLFVRRLDVAVEFWTQAFAMEVVTIEAGGSAAFLRLSRSANHHDLGLFAVGTDAPDRHPRSPGLYHLAWQVDTIDELVEARETLSTLGALRGDSSHGATKSIYGSDPDGNEFEVMWMVPREEWGAFESAAPVERLDLASDVSRWSGVRTASPF